METRYPIVLAHGVLLKDVLCFRSFGRIEKQLKKSGHRIFSADHDGFGCIETNAIQLKAYIEKTLAETGAEKVNIIAHSKGGLDSLYMIDNLGMRDKIASLTFISTPHRGSAVAVFLYSLPKIIRWPVVFVINTLYRILGDKKPNAIGVCRQLLLSDEDAVPLKDPTTREGIYMQSYTAVLKRSRDDFVMGFPLLISKCYGHTPGDGMVSVASGKYGEYRGTCTDLSVSHGEIAGFMIKPHKKKKIYGFYISVADELAQKGL